MSGATSFDAAEAAKVVTQYHTAVENIKRTVDAITDTIASAKGWQGEAKLAGDKTVEAWGQEASDIKRRIQEMNDTIEEGNATLGNVDPDNVANLTNLV
ncbi:WXG100 family type VII secretion target [Nocardia sp. NPDC127579]|uniref:WXG100 family type VII secretion target n=1 Tax=Nocardia sp. NPDC127579 TaxID=3345402 RepID=UPI00362B9F59